MTSGQAQQELAKALPLMQKLWLLVEPHFSARLPSRFNKTFTTIRKNLQNLAFSGHCREVG
jgi:hypothetical protein